jgi:hypothetical protein
MTFILSSDYPPNTDVDLAELDTRWARYRAYLRSIRAQLPPSVYDFAIADWHYEHDDPRCLHDAWVETLTIAEPSTGDRRQYRKLAIRIRLLSAHHTGHIELQYDDVVGYSIQKPSLKHLDGTDDGHGDLSVDEIRLSERGNVIHEIEFTDGSRWLIECRDLYYAWQPFAK